MSDPNTQQLYRLIQKLVYDVVNRALKEYKPDLTKSFGALGSKQIASNAVSTPKIVDGAVTTAKIPDASISVAKLDFDPATQSELDAHISLTTSAHGGIVPSSRTITIDGVSHDLSSDRSWSTSGGTPLTIEELDGTPSESAPTKLIFPNGTLSVASHQVTYTPSGGGGGSSVIHTDVFASPPSSPSDGDTWVPSDAPYVAYRVSGAWIWRFAGRPVVPPDILGLTAVNQGSATINHYGAITILAPTSGSEFRLLVKSTPAATFKWRVGLARGHFDVNYASAGILVRDSVTGKMTTLALYQSGGIMIQNYSGYSSGFAGTPFGPLTGFIPDYLEIEEDATTRYFRIGRLGMYMQTITTQPINTYVTPDQVGIYVDANNGSYPALLDIYDTQLT